MRDGIHTPNTDSFHASMSCTTARVPTLEATGSGCVSRSISQPNQILTQQILNPEVAGFLTTYLASPLKTATRSCRASRRGLQDTVVLFVGLRNFFVAS